jgi:hypothetical protein
MMIDPHGKQTVHTAVLLAAAVLLPAALYLTSGILGGFLEADDFGWLSTARDQHWNRIFSFGGYDHFYRPVTRAWFFAVVRLCEDSPACYHALNLSVHLINTALFTGLSIVISRDPVFAALAGLIFAIAPGYVEAVAWVSAITELLSTLFVLTSTLLVFSAIRRDSLTLWYVAALTALMAVFAHEASAVVFALIPLLLWSSGHIDRIRLRHVVPFIIVGGLALSAMIVANHRNTIFTEHQYTIGPHMIRQTLDYFISMYVGPHRWTGRVFVAVAAVSLAAFGPRISRVGFWWILITLLPFLGFTTGNASRYLYLPTMGFGWVAAGLLLALHRRIGAFTSYRVATGVVAVLTGASIARFCVFTSKSVASHNESSAVYRDYAQMVVDRKIYKDGVTELIVPGPIDASIDRASIPPMLRWVLKQRNLIVIVDDSGVIDLR